jgi:uncharacterized FAD-dependent dehydrogenase
VQSWRGKWQSFIQSYSLKKMETSLERACMKKKICIVGLGPAGIAAALTFANSTCAKEVLCIDAGSCPSERYCAALENQSCRKEKFCKVISGFGGCSLISGGKVSGYPAGNSLSSILGSDELARVALGKALGVFGQYLQLEKPNVVGENIEKAKKMFSEKGFDFRYYDAFLYNQAELGKAYERIIIQLRSSGLSISMDSELTGVKRKKSGYELTVKQADSTLNIDAEYLILGMGRLGRRLMRKINADLDLHGEENFIDVGVRLEFPTDIFPDVWRYHNDLKLVFGNARTFCVCREGRIAQYFIEGLCCTEGFCSNDGKTGLTNLGIIVRFNRPTIGNSLFSEIKEQMLQVSSERIVRQDLLDYLNLAEKQNVSKLTRNSQLPWVNGDVNACFPGSVSDEIKKAVAYFVNRMFPKENWNMISVFAPEIDYGGLQFPVKPNFSVIPKLHLIGDGTGRFRGILQSFSSGIVCAENIVGDTCEKGNQE